MATMWEPQQQQQQLMHEQQLMHQKQQPQQQEQQQLLQLKHQFNTAAVVQHQVVQPFGNTQRTAADVFADYDSCSDFIEDAGNEHVSIEAIRHHDYEESEHARTQYEEDVRNCGYYSESRAEDGSDPDLDSEEIWDSTTTTSVEPACFDTSYSYDITDDRDSDLVPSGWDNSYFHY